MWKRQCHATPHDDGNARRRATTTERIATSDAAEEADSGESGERAGRDGGVEARSWRSVVAVVASVLVGGGDAVRAAPEEAARPESRQRPQPVG